MTRTALHDAWSESAPLRKCAAVAALMLPAGEFRIGFSELGLSPGRPPRPELVHPREVPRRALGTAEGRAALVHAVAHIEFNAINLALDAALRFAGLPAQYYRDWLSVAQDEARHFTLLQGRLAELGFNYGDFTAHNGLWEAAEKTSHDVLARMALVPRVLEARGLDVTPGLINRMRELKDSRTAEILGIILAEEVRHVAIGSHWYRWLCAGRGLDPQITFRQLLREHGMRVRAPLNRPARLQAGFEELELVQLLEGDALEP